jgi:hypothetical protein
MINSHNDTDMLSISSKLNKYLINIFTISTLFFVALSFLQLNYSFNGFTQNLSDNGKLFLETKVLRDDKSRENIELTDLEPNKDFILRAYYNNKSESKIEKASIQIKLPDGFVSKSIKTCLNPNIRELTCSQPFSSKGLVGANNLLTVSPIAGLYDGADKELGTSVDSTNGLIDIGKKKYLNLNQCIFLEKNNVSFNYLTIFNNGSSNNINGKKWHSTTNAATNSPNLGSGCTSGSDEGWPLSSSSNAMIDIFSQRNLYINQCTYFKDKSKGNPNGTISTISPNGVYPAKSTTASNKSLASSCTPANDFNLKNDLSGIYKGSILGNRYLHLHQCSYNNSFKDRGTFTTNDSQTVIIPVSDGRYTSSTTLNNSSSMGLQCGGGGDWRYEGLNSGVQTLDLIDTNRGSGYVELLIQSPEKSSQDAKLNTSNILVSVIGKDIKSLNTSNKLVLRSSDSSKSDKSSLLSNSSASSNSSTSSSEATSQSQSSSTYINLEELANKVLKIGCNTTDIIPKNTDLTCGFKLPTDITGVFPDVLRLKIDNVQSDPCYLDADSLVIYCKLNSANLTGKKDIYLNLDSGESVKTATQLQFQAENPVKSQQNNNWFVKMWPWFVIPLIIILIAGLAYYFLIYKKRNQDKDNESGNSDNNNGTKPPKIPLMSNKVYK